MLTDSQRQKSAGGGGRGRGPPRDYDNPSYGQPSNTSSAPSNVPPGGAAPAAAGAGGQADPYAMCEYMPFASSVTASYHNTNSR
jgi:far upstream element-binding protein